MVKFYQRLRDIREDHDLTQQKIADILKMKYQQYARYETGQQQMPMEHYKTLARYYNISLDYLAGLTPTPKTLDGTPYKIANSVNIINNGQITNHFK